MSAYQVMLARAPVEERARQIWQYVHKQGAYGCWLWTGERDSTGSPITRWEPPHYTQRTEDGLPRPTLVYRITWFWETGINPVGMQIHHLCKQHTCVNPHHLALVTRQAQNIVHGQPPNTPYRTTNVVCYRVEQ